MRAALTRVAVVSPARAVAGASALRAVGALVATVSLARESGRAWVRPALPWARAGAADVGAPSGLGVRFTR